MVAAYLGWAKKNYGPEATEYEKAKRVVRSVRAVYGTNEAAQFGYQQFEAVRSSLVADGVGRFYINASMDRLVRIFKWAASRNLIPPAVPQSLAMIE